METYTARARQSELVLSAKTRSSSQSLNFAEGATLSPPSMTLYTQPLNGDPPGVTASSPMGILFDEWRPHVEAEAGHFVEDGIVCKESWRIAKRKVLFLLKEPNGYKGEQGALNELLRKAAAPNSTNSMWDRPTFHNVGRWTHGLLNYSGEVPDYDEANRACKTAVLGCAYINIKKSSGGARATKEVEVHADKYAEFLKRQVALIQPDIVVCGGTYKLLKKHVYPGLSRVSKRVHQFENRIFINAYHPGYITNRKRMYEQVLSSFHEYMVGNSRSSEDGES